MISSRCNGPSICDKCKKEVIEGDYTRFLISDQKQLSFCDNVNLCSICLKKVLAFELVELYLDKDLEAFNRLKIEDPNFRPLYLQREDMMKVFKNEINN